MELTVTCWQLVIARRLFCQLTTTQGGLCFGRPSLIRTHWSISEKNVSSTGAKAPTIYSQWKLLVKYYFLLIYTTLFYIVSFGDWAFVIDISCTVLCKWFCTMMLRNRLFYITSGQRWINIFGYTNLGCYWPSASNRHQNCKWVLSSYCGDFICF